MDGGWLKGNFQSVILMKAEVVAAGSGICVVYGFEPFPPYFTVVDPGFEYLAEKISDTKYRA